MGQEVNVDALLAKLNSKPTTNVDDLLAKLNATDKPAPEPNPLSPNQPAYQEPSFGQAGKPQLGENPDIPQVAVSDSGDMKPVSQKQSIIKIKDENGKEIVMPDDAKFKEGDKVTYTDNGKKVNAQVTFKGESPLQYEWSGDSLGASQQHNVEKVLSTQEKQKQVDDAYNAQNPILRKATIAAVKATNGAIDLLNNTTQFLTGTAFGIGSKDLKEGTQKFFDDLKSPEPTSANYDPKKGVTADNVAGSIGGMIPVLAGFAVGTGEISTALQGVNELGQATRMAKPIADAVGTITTNAVMSYNSAYDEATKAGEESGTPLSEAEKNAFAMRVTGVSGMLFAVLPAISQIRGLGTPAEISKVASKSFVDALKTSSVKDATDIALKTVKETVLDNAKNAGIMTSLTLNDKLQQAITNHDAGRQVFDAEIHPQEIADNLLLNALTLSPLSALHGYQTYSENNTLQKQVLATAAENPEHYHAVIKQAFADGKILRLTKQLRCSQRCLKKCRLPTR